VIRRGVEAFVAGWVVVAGIVTFTIADVVRFTGTGLAGATSSTITVRENGFAFTPRVIEAPPSARVTIRVVNDSWTRHSFTMQRPAVDLMLGAGDIGTVTFTVPASGDIPYYCRFHQALGMNGQFIVQAVP
jgi:plastocyanin